MLLERWNRQFMVSEWIRFDVRAAFFPMTTPKLGSICLDMETSAGKLPSKSGCRL